ncbi:Gfo/Idh/MocA family oxidoreductase [Schleiferiaceae bacterium]|nr:Gfo/Idh/MocA family oxidoreductase [Schleiferiaceae bacterium]
MNILIVGLGSIGRKHVDALIALGIKAKIYALRSSLNVKKEEYVENIFGLENLKVKFDFAIISNPTNLHFKYIKILAERGVHLFIEKPVLHTLEKSDELVRIVEAKDIYTYVACNLRFHPCLIFIDNWLKLESPRINEVNVYCGSYLPDWRPGVNFRDMYSANHTMGGGVHLDLFHEIDYTVWLFGLPSKTNAIRRNVSTLNIDAIDYANYCLEYDGFSANIVLNYYRKNPKRALEIVCSDRTIYVDMIASTIIDDTDKVLLDLPEYKISQTYYDQMSYFIRCLKNEVRPINSLKYSFQVLNIVLQNE